MATINLTPEEVTAVVGAIDRDVAQYERNLRLVRGVPSEAMAVDNAVAKSYRDRIDNLMSVRNRLTGGGK